MPRHLTCDAHEWINEIPAVPGRGPANRQGRERATARTSAGKEDPFEFDSNRAQSADPRGVE